MSESGSGQVAKATRRDWLGLAVLTVPSMLALVDISVLFLALPQLSADLGASATEQLWITDIYGFMTAGLLVTMGTLGDRIGRKKLFLIGALAFGVLSALAAYSTSPEMLLIVRLLLGIAGATIIPTTLALITQMFKDPKQMGAAIAVWASGLTAGVALGPVIGGVLLHWFWWGSVFLIGAPIMALVVIFGSALLPEFKDPKAGRLDPVSVVLSLAAILPFIFGFKELARNGWNGWYLVSIVVGLAFGYAFVTRQRRLTSPLLDLRLFSIRAVSGILILAILIAAVQGGSGFFLAQHLQLVDGRSPLGAGLWILVPTAALLVGIGMSQGLSQAVKPGYVLAGGTVIAAVGMFILSQVDSVGGLGMLVVGFSVVFFGVAPVGPLAGQLVVPAAPPEKAGQASALQTTAGDLGVALGIALLGSVGTAVFRGDVTIPAEIAGTPAAATAGETAAGALDVASTLPPAQATALIDSARAAFNSGMNTVAVICAFVFISLAVLAVLTLRHVAPLAGQGHGAPPPADAEAGSADGDAEGGAHEGREEAA